VNVKGCRPNDLAIDLLDRSTCAVQVACVIADSHGIFAWGHNHIGFDGLGCHAERYALMRANRRRLLDSTVYVAARRRKSGNTVTAKPCEECQLLLKHVSKVMYRDKENTWQRL